MNKNHKLTGSGPLLDKNGALREAGWSTRLCYDYNPENVSRAKKPRLKEWDYYHIINHEGKYAVSFTFADNYYMGLVTCSVFDFETKEKFDCTETKIMPKGSLGLPKSSENGNIEYTSKSCVFNIDRTDDGRHNY